MKWTAGSVSFASLPLSLSSLGIPKRRPLELYRFPSSLSPAVGQEELQEDEQIGDPVTSRAFFDNFAPVKEEEEQRPLNAVVVKTRDPLPSEHVKREGGGEKEREEGFEKDRSKPRLGKKRSAIIASLVTPTVKQRRWGRN